MNIRKGPALATSALVAMVAGGALYHEARQTPPEPKPQDPILVVINGAEDFDVLFDHFEKHLNDVAAKNIPWINASVMNGWGLACRSQGKFMAKALKVDGRTQHGGAIAHDTLDDMRLDFAQYHAYFRMMLKANVDHPMERNDVFSTYLDFLGVYLNNLLLIEEQAKRRAQGTFTPECAELTGEYDPDLFHGRFGNVMFTLSDKWNAEIKEWMTSSTPLHRHMNRDESEPRDL